MLEIITFIGEIFGEAIAGAALKGVVGVFAHVPKGSKQNKPYTVEFKSYESIRDLYVGSKKIKEDQFVEIRGSLSKYAPLLPGSPFAKRDFHRRLRRDIQKIQELLRKRRHKITPTTIDALMSYSAGQMVIRKHIGDSNYYYLGLYHSIVRNSIPVFVNRDYYDKSVSRFFSEANNPCTIEANVKGRIRFFDHNIDEIIKKYDLGKIFDDSFSDELLTPLAIYVEGPEINQTQIDYCGESKYLDGDIWVAVKTRAGEKVVSRFIDLANEDDLAEETKELRNDAIEQFAGCVVISQFDEIQKPFVRDRIPKRK